MLIPGIGQSSVLDVNGSQLGNCTKGTGPSFFECLGKATQTEAVQESTGNAGNSYTGFFAQIQEKRMKELREEILNEMGLSEEMLAKMDPESRGRIETIIAKEIQKRMTAESAMEEDQEHQAMHKRVLMADVDFLSL